MPRLASHVRRDAEFEENARYHRALATELRVRLDTMRDRTWLSSYTLGELYVGGEFAANKKV